MIGYIKGEILENQDGNMVVGVGASTGKVGYAVAVPQNEVYELLPIGQMIELFVYTHVAEKALDLYGFSTRMEKELFLVLIEATGVGPKGALGILSKAEPRSLIQALLDADKEALEKMPGVGKSKAEKFVLELSKRLRKRVEAGAFGNLKPVVPRGTTRPATGAQGGSLFRDAKDALVGLGYKEPEVTSLLNRVLSESEVPPARAEELIRTALQQLAQ